MAFVVTDNCIKCKYTDCVTVCPVDCFHEGENMLVIDPLVCIDCGVCVAECPAKAISPESEELSEWIELNSVYSQIWPVLTHAKPHHPEAASFDGIPNKKAKYFIDK